MILAALALAAAPSAAAPVSPLAPPPGYRLVWSEEFSGSGLPDPRKWDWDTDFNRRGWHNKEKQYYAARRKRNSRVQGGRLIVEAHADGAKLSRRADHGGQAYSSARMVTRGKAAWTYGFFEVRAKLPCGLGTWPAIWTLAARRVAGWPGDGEIDIMEHVSQDPGTIHQTIHTAAFNHVAGTQKSARRQVADACSAFHDYQLHWTQDRIVMGIDGEPLFAFDKPSGDRAEWPFDAPQYLILNLAIGGWGGEKGIDDEALPQRMEVDYVRVWQAPAS